jgi:hypothetical protein
MDSYTTPSFEGILIPANVIATEFKDHIAELQQELPTTPILEEHAGAAIGTIQTAFRDGQGNLCVTGKLYSQEQIGQNGVDIRERLKSGLLKALSIGVHWIQLKNGQRLLKLVESSLVENPRFKGAVIKKLLCSEDYLNTNEIVVESIMDIKTAPEQATHQQAQVNAEEVMRQVQELQAQLNQVKESNRLYENLYQKEQEKHLKTVIDVSKEYNLGVTFDEGLKSIALDPNMKSLWTFMSSLASDKLKLQKETETLTQDREKLGQENKEFTTKYESEKKQWQESLRSSQGPDQRFKRPAEEPAEVAHVEKSLNSEKRVATEHNNKALRAMFPQADTTMFNATQKLSQAGLHDQKQGTNIFSNETDIYNRLKQMSSKEVRF